MALYVVYAIITYILTVLFNMFIPHCMRTAERKEPINASSSEQICSPETKTPNTEANTLGDGKMTTKPLITRKYGFKMSIWGAISTAAGGILALVVVIILSQTLPAARGQSAGLLVTTVVGFITIAGSIVVYLGLPAIPAKPKKDRKAWRIELFTPLKDLLQRKNMAVLLLSYTIYTDTVFVLNSVTSQLFFIEIMPGTLEYSLYSMAFNIFGAVTMLGFYLWQLWRPPFSLEYWLVIGYALVLIIPIWGCIGLAGNINFGFKVTIPSMKNVASVTRADVVLGHRTDGNFIFRVLYLTFPVRLSILCFASSSQSWCRKEARLNGSGCKWYYPVQRYANLVVNT